MKSFLHWVLFLLAFTNSAFATVLPQTTAYAWTPGDDLASVTYPSGRTVAYTRNAIGNVTGITTNGSNVLSGRTYRADGLVKSQTWANGVNETRAYDLQGRMAIWTAGSVLNRTYAYDANGNVVQKDAAQFQYDDLDRLTWEPGQSLLYDGNGNRLLDAAGGYGYEAASNRMATGPPGSVTLDAAGNTLAYAGQSYTYNQAGRLTSATASGQIATYTYRHDGLRASKTVNGTTTYFHHDPAGRLIAESDSTGQTLREYVWDDEVPVAQIEGGGVTYLHTDALGTPRLGTNQSGAVVWAWDSDAFGATAPSGSVTINLRFPGQYFDAETGLHQNGQRTYHPPSGRYLESDPIGLAGGLNSFGYVGGNPLRFVDPLGLAVETPWDAANVVLDATSLAANVAAGNIGGAVVDGAGLVYDLVATAVPGLPGGAGTAIKACRAGQEVAKGTSNLLRGGQGFRSFRALKESLGPAGNGKHWHHIVEQSQAAKFGANMVHNTKNVAAIPTFIHTKISGYYSSKQPFTNGMTVRQWLRDQPFNEQYQFGLNVMKRFGAQ